MCNMSVANVRVRYAKQPDRIETIGIKDGADWSTLQRAIVASLGISMKMDEELFCVFINSSGKVASAVICRDSEKFWKTYMNKYSADVTSTVIFEVNTRQCRAAKPSPATQQTHAPAHSYVSKTQTYHQSESEGINRGQSMSTPIKNVLDIHVASKTGNLRRVQELIKHHAASVNARDDQSSTPLHYASEFGHLPLVQYLVSQKAFKNNRNSNGRTPLLNAVVNGHLDVVKYLVEERAFSFVLDNDGNGPLHLAAKHNNTSILEWLLSIGGIDKMLRNSKGELYSACFTAIPQSDKINTAKSVVTQPMMTQSDEALKWTLVCTEPDLRLESFSVLADLDMSSWQSFCFSVLVLFNIEGLSGYLVKDKYTMKYTSNLNEDIFRSIPTLVEYMVLVEQDGDEGSGHVKDLPKFLKILNKIYRSDEGMSFEMHISGNVLKKYQSGLKKSSSTEPLTPKVISLTNPGVL